MRLDVAMLCVGGFEEILNIPKHSAEVLQCST